METKRTDDNAKKSQKKGTSDSVEAKDTLKPTASKAGKRSAKAIAEAEEKVAKEERKQATAKPDTKSEQPTTATKPPRSQLERAGKKYRQAAEQIESGKSYNLAEAVDLALKTSPATFDATVELHINLVVDPKQADQNVRGFAVLPHGSGKKQRVAAFVEGADEAKAKQAGAQISGADSIAAQLDKGQIDFDILIAPPALMPRLGQYAKLLGPKGLMPNPKSGTVTNDVAKAIKDALAGQIEYRVDQAGIIHLGIGKVSFGPQKVLDNAQQIMTSVRSAKPPSVKGKFIKSAYVTTTMGPSIKIET